MMEDLPRTAPRWDKYRLRRLRKSIINPHYYGDIVRRLFLTAGIVIAFSTPLFFHLAPKLSIPVFSLIVVVTLVFLAGYTSPAKKRVVELDIISSALAIVLFGISAFLAWRSDHPDWHRVFFFFLLSGLGLIFIFALYYSVKSLRGISSSKESYPEI
ncbi:MAG: hypothetical protein G01um101430_518 [Parcubacteria group bacterium Gr01-1014_30]|nr:MAG: hypothetical protein G01um101430_518 [Parcubacteria group bacterium Gr01-1014_30]